MDKDVEKVLTRGVESVLPDTEGLAKLMQKRKITLYQGFDPSSPNLHIGHLIGIRKLAQFQKLGHKVIFLIGDFTGMIGDPTDKASVRKRLSKKEIIENTKGYKQQVKKVLKFSGNNPAKILFNSKWLSELKFENIVDIASNFTVQQMLERSFFQDRIKQEKPIYLHEFLYPLMVSYDCVHMDVDLEIGGSDQLFNMMAGRSLMQAIKKKEKFVLTMKLFGMAMGKKMSKSEGFTINLSNSPPDLFGSIMAIPDSSISLGIELLTDLPINYAKDKSSMEAKKSIAFEVVKQIKAEGDAKLAQKHFEETFQKKTPSYEKEVKLKDNLIKTVSLASGASISETKRLISQGAVDIDGKAAKDVTYKLKGGEKMKIGKKIFVRVSK